MELILAFLALLVAIVFTGTLYRKPHSRLPPAPYALPLIGHLHLLSGHPHKALQQLSKKYGPYMLLKFGLRPALIVSTAKAAKEVLKTHDLTFASRPQSLYASVLNYDGQDLVMAPYGKHWRETRKLCTLELFTSKQAVNFRPLREARISKLISHLRSNVPGSRIDMREMFSAFNFDITTSMVMGNKSSFRNGKDASTFRDLLNEREKLSTGAGIGNYLPFLMWLDTCLNKLKKNQQIMDGLLERQVAEHRIKRLEKDHQSKDFIDVMLSLCDEGKLEHTTLKALALNIIAAGTETSSVTSEWVMAELVKNPRIMAKLQKELDEVVGSNNKVTESHLDKLEYLQATVKESFRLHPPVPLLLPHESTQECELENKKFLIPAGTQLFVNIYAIGRDAETWKENTLDFMPERFLGSSMDVGGQHYELLPFGSGRRSCPGINLALPSVHLMVANLVHEFEWHVPDGEELDMEESAEFMLRPARPTVLIPVARH